MKIKGVGRVAAPVARAIDGSEAQTSGTCGLPRGFALRGPLRCASRCHARARFGRTDGFPVGDRAAVGVFGLLRKRALGGTDLLVAHALAGRDLTLARRRAGDELKLSDLAPRHRRLGEAVVLLACEQTPKQGRELAC